MTSSGDSDRGPVEQRVAALTERVTELEIALTYQRQTTGALDELVRELFSMIERLKAQIESLEADPGLSDD